MSEHEYEDTHKTSLQKVFLSFLTLFIVSFFAISTFYTLADDLDDFTIDNDTVSQNSITDSFLDEQEEQVSLEEATDSQAEWEEPISLEEVTDSQAEWEEQVETNEPTTNERIENKDASKELITQEESSLGIALMAIETFATGDFDSGFGTDTDPYMITTQEHLDNVRNQLNAHYKLGADITLSGTWTPIGGVSSQFAGTLDGNNRTISNLTLDGSNSANDQALFGYVGTNGIVKNLTLSNAKINITSSGTDIACIAGENKGLITNCHITTNSTLTTNGNNVGSIVGENQGTITNCTADLGITGTTNIGGITGKNTGTVNNCTFSSNSSISGTSYIGGIVGYMQSGSITDCIVRSNPTIDGTNFIGGIVGYLLNGTIEDCSLQTNVKIAATSQIGGIVGDMVDGTIRNCTNQSTGGITIKDSSSAENIGGIAGYNTRGTIEGCTNEMTISLTSDKWHFAGIVGCNYSGIVKDCTNKASITISGSIVGGVVGKNLGTIENCHNTGDVKCTGKDSLAYLGGVAGMNYKDSSVASITNCTNTGTVTSEGSYANIGGIAGYNHSSCTISESSNTGTIKSMNGSGDLHVGGIVGSNQGSILECYNTGGGSVTNSNSGNNTGGIAGLNNGGLVDHCYNNASGIISGNYNTGGIVGKNIGQVRNCYNIGTGTIQGSNDNVAGIVGSNDGVASISNCYNTNSNLTTSTNNLGGIAGCNVSGGTVHNCYNRGTIAYINSSDKKASVVGSNGQTVTYCYWDNTADTIGINGGTTSNCTSFTVPTNVVDSKSLTETLNDNLQANYLTWRDDTDSYSIFGEPTPTIDLTSSIITDIDSDYTYSGSDIEPTPTVTLDTTELIQGSDYTITYSDNKNVGANIATITITGIGNYTGTITITFSITPKKLVVIPDSGQSHTIGESESAITYQVIGTEGGETPVFTGSLTRETGEEAGNYAILGGTLTLIDGTGFLASNYTLTIKDDVTYEIIASDEDSKEEDSNDEDSKEDNSNDEDSKEEDSNDEGTPEPDENELESDEPESNQDSITEYSHNTEEEEDIPIEEESIQNTPPTPTVVPELDSSETTPVTGSNVTIIETTKVPESYMGNLPTTTVTNAMGIAVASTVGTVAVVAGGAAVAIASAGAAATAATTTATGTTLTTLAGNNPIQILQQLKSKNGLKIKKIKLKKRKVFSEKILQKNATLLRYAIGQYHLDTYDDVTRVLIESKHLKAPTVICVNHLLDGSEKQYHNAIDEIRAIMKENKIKIPVCIHLDDGNFEECYTAISLGYSSVIYHAPDLPLKTQLEEMKTLSKLAKKKSSILELKYSLFDELGRPQPLSASELTRLAKLKIYSLTIDLPASCEDFKTLALNTIHDIREVTKSFHFTIHFEGQFSYEEFKELLKLKVTKVNIPYDYEAVLDEQLLKKDLETIHSLGKSTDFLKLANYGYKGLRFLLKQLI
ncbi:MAG: GLUG motif-containing protein [Eubacteriales bacterium]